MIRIVSDSTCDLTKEILQEYDIEMVPLHIVLGDTEYRDRVEISQDKIFEWSEANKTTPKTSAVSFDDTQKVFEPILSAGDEIIAFTISEPMSNTANVFRMVAEELNASDRVHVVDSKSLSNGVGILAVEASEMVREGKSAEEIVTAVEDMRERLNVSFVIDTLTYLARGGRCNSVVALAGGVLKLHPKIVLTGGKMEVDKKYRGPMSGVVLSYAKDMEDKLLASDTKRVYLVSTGVKPEIVESVRQYLEDLHYFDEIMISVAGGVISSHCGPGTLGVMYIEK